MAKFSQLRRLDIEEVDDAQEVIDWARSAPEVDTLTAQVPLVDDRSDLKSRTSTIVTPMITLLHETRLATVQLDDWRIRRRGKALSLEWAGTPFWSAHEAWTLVAFAQSGLSIEQVTITFANAFVLPAPIKRALAAAGGPFRALASRKA